MACQWGWMVIERHWWVEGAERTNVDGWKRQNRQNYDGHWTKLWWTSNKTMTNIGRNYYGHQTELRQNKTKWTTITTDINRTSNDATKWSMFVSSTTMAWCKKEERFFFSYFVCVFFFILFFFQNCYKGYSLRDYKLKKHTWLHNSDANLKTHVQGKQVYVGLHHLVQILYCNQTLCVCVCVCVRVRAPKT